MTVKIALAVSVLLCLFAIEVTTHAIWISYTELKASRIEFNTAHAAHDLTGQFKAIDNELTALGKETDIWWMFR